MSWWLSDLAARAQLATSAVAAHASKAVEAGMATAAHASATISATAADLRDAAQAQLHYVLEPPDAEDSRQLSTRRTRGRRAGAVLTPRPDPVADPSALPWNDDDLPPPARAELRLRVLQLSESDSTFLSPPPPAAAYHVDLAAHAGLALALLDEDPRLAAARARLVPRRVADDDFWVSYFFRLHAVVHAMDAFEPPASSAERQAPELPDHATLAAAAAAAQLVPDAPGYDDLVLAAGTGAGGGPGDELDGGGPASFLGEFASEEWAASADGAPASPVPSALGDGPVGGARAPRASSADLDEEALAAELSAFEAAPADESGVSAARASRDGSRHCWR